MVNPTPYYLNGYFKKNYPDYAQYIVWKPSILYKQSEEELVEFMVKNDIDVFCASLYLWNVDATMRALPNIKRMYQERTGKLVKIVLGGPSCDALYDDWQRTYPFVDHFVVGQGEKAWANLALDFLGVSKLDGSASNIVHFVRDTKEKSYNYEFIRGIHYSPYLESQELVKELITVYENLGFKLAWPYETQRGCPYHCTFCDWNGGQSNKTQKRKEINFLDEIDFFAENKMYNLHLSDANFGMWDVDLEIMKRLVEHKQNGHPFTFFSFNMSKIINKNFKEIMKLIVKHNFNGVWVKLSVQDINPDVLKAIDRPGDWNELKEFGLDLYKEFHITKNLNKIFVELILGLPGQTYDSWIETLDEVYSSGFIPRTYPFLLLRNAPATYDVAYREKFGIKDGLAFEVLDTVLSGNSIQEVVNDTINNYKIHQIVECNTFSEKDYVRMSMADQMYRRLCSRTKWKAYSFVDVNWQHLKPIITKMMQTDDWNYVVEQRYHNFKTHRINALDSSEGKILVDGNDMSSIIARNFHLIEESFKETNIDSATAEQFLSEWRTFLPTKHFLDR